MGCIMHSSSEPLYRRWKRPRSKTHPRSRPIRNVRNGSHCAARATMTLTGTPSRADMIDCAESVGDANPTNVRFCIGSAKGPTTALGQKRIFAGGSRDRWRVFLSSQGAQSCGERGQVRAAERDAMLRVRLRPGAGEGAYSDLTASTRLSLAALHAG